MQTKETPTLKTFLKDKVVLKKEVIQSKGTQSVQIGDDSESDENDEPKTTTIKSHLTDT